MCQARSNQSHCSSGGFLQKESRQHRVHGPRRGFSTLLQSLKVGGGIMVMEDEGREKWWLTAGVGDLSSGFAHTENM